MEAKQQGEEKNELKHVWVLAYGIVAQFGVFVFTWIWFFDIGFEFGFKSWNIYFFGGILIFFFQTIIKKYEFQCNYFYF